MDRTLVYGRMYRSTMRYDAGICAGKRMIACVTTGASAASCGPDGREGDTRMHLWPILFPFRYLGFTVYEPEIYHGIGAVSSMEEQSKGTDPQQALNAAWSAALTGLPDRANIAYNADHEFSDDKRPLPGAPSYSPFVRHQE